MEFRNHKKTLQNYTWKFIFSPLLLFNFYSIAQTDTVRPHRDVANSYDIRKDLIDVYNSVFKRNAIGRSDTVKKTTNKVHTSFIPSPGYSIQTGFNISITNNNAFYLSKNSNISSILLVVAYTEFNQILIPMQSNIFTKNNSWDFLGDWRYLKFPIPTYGLGNQSKNSDALPLNYDYLRISELALKKIDKHLYAGGGYNLNYHWNITQGGNRPSFYDNYGYKPSSISSGIALCIQYDSRENSLNPGKAAYFNATYCNNNSYLGSNSNYSSLVIDARKYINFPKGTRNILALWNYDWLTLNGIPPYLDLPSTGWDTYSNTGRGYAQGRFRGMSMIDFEAEYRLRLVTSGLIGMVFFGNLQSYSTRPNIYQFNALIPGGGVGLRIKFNKFSNINASIDYGFGVGGSNGVFFNLGEVF